jgi:hypothetical protein
MGAATGVPVFLCVGPRPLRTNGQTWSGRPCVALSPTPGLSFFPIFPIAGTGFIGHGHKTAERRPDGSGGRGEKA